MELFPPEPSENLLPCDGEVRYFGPVFDAAYLPRLLGEPGWRQDELVMFGKPIRMSRELIYFGEKDYTYSGVAKPARAWSPLLKEIKERVEQLTATQFNACLANLYHSGEDGMGWHSDDEPEIEPRSPIASVSFGAERKFVLRHKQSREKVEVWLQPGSLLIMAGDCQQAWQHTLPKTKRVSEPRVNLTFRQMRASS